MIMCFLGVFSGEACAQDQLRLVIPIGHTDDVVSARFSPDGKKIVTASEDNTAKIWDAASGRLLTDLNGHTGELLNARFSPDGKQIITVSRDQTARIWNAETGQLIRKVLNPPEQLEDALFSPDGKEILVAGWLDVKLMDAYTDELLFQFSDTIESLCFRPDAKQILTSSYFNAKIWDAETGKLLLFLKGNGEFLSEVFYTKDGERIIAISQDDHVLCWDALTGTELTVTPYQRTDERISPDGKRRIRKDYGIVEVLDSLNGTYYRLDGPAKNILAVHFFPDGSKTVSSDEYNTQIWQVNTGQPVKQLGGQRMNQDDLNFSPDGSRMITFSRANEAVIWDAGSLKAISTLTLRSGNILSAQFSPDGKKCLTTDDDYYAATWDALKGEFLGKVFIDDRPFGSVHICPDGSQFITQLPHWSYVHCWNANTAAEEWLIHDIDGIIWGAQYSPNGSGVMTYGASLKVNFWSDQSGSLLFSLTGHSDYIYSAHFSRDGNLLLTTSADSTARVWDVVNQKCLFTLRGHKAEVTSADIRPDGKIAATLSDDNTIKLWDLTNGNLLLTIDDGHAGRKQSVKYSPDGTMLMTLGSDRKVKFWEAATGRLLYTRVEFNEEDYLVYDEFFRFDGTPVARDYVYLTCGSEIIELAQMKDALYVPGLVEKIMSHQEIHYPKLSDLDLCGALPSIESVDDNEGYHFLIRPGSLGFNSIDLYINDKKVYSFDKKDMSLQGDVWHLIVPEEEVELHFLEGQKNAVRAIAVVNWDNREIRSRGTVISRVDKEESSVTPSFYAVMVGVDDYRDAHLHLNYPAKDAWALGNAIEISAAKLLGPENVHIYRIHRRVKDEKAFSSPEKEGILKALADIGTKARPEDLILVFLAGHGVMMGEKDQVFTFLTAESSTDKHVGITIKELQEWLSYEGPNKILANKAILIFDACNSGQVTQDLLALARSDEDSRKIRQIEDLKDKSGMFILAASAANQSAYEMPQYEQGLLTYCLLHTLKNNSGVLDDERFLNVQKWFLESENLLQQLVSSLGYDQDAQPFGSANIRIGEVDQEVKNSIVLAAEKPMVVCANVLNELTYDDDLHLKNLVNQELIRRAESSASAPIAFSRQESGDVNTINIVYAVTDEAVKCNVRLLKSGKLLHSTTVNGMKKELEVLASRIVSDVLSFVE